MRTIAIMNNKGGVGKTVTAINLADILVRDYKKRVVLADCDGQMNLTKFYFPSFDPEEHVTVADVLTGDCEPVWSDNLIPIAPDLDLLPGASGLYMLDLLAIDKGNQTARPRMLDFCQAAAEDGTVDFMILDCPPGYNVSSTAALGAADEVVIPMLVDGFGYSGVEMMRDQLADLRRMGYKAKIAGVLMTSWQNEEYVRQGETLIRSIGVPVFRQVIRRTNKVPESTLQKEPIALYSPGSAASQDYRKWVREYMEEYMEEVH